MSQVGTKWNLDDELAAIKAAIEKKRASSSAIRDWAADQLFGPWIDSEKRPYVLADALESADTPEKVWTLFNVGWPCCDAVHPVLIRDILKVLLAQPCKGTEFLTGADQDFFDSLPTAFTVFRGASQYNRHGIAWTTDIEIAREFAKGHRDICVPSPAIFECVVRKSDVLTVCTDRDESEIILKADWSKAKITSIQKFARAHK